MKNLGRLVKIVEAEPVSGFSPAKPSKPARIAKPAQPSRTRAQVRTPKGRLATVKTPAAMRKPGYDFIKYLPPKTRGVVHARSHRNDKGPKHPIKPITYSQTKPITEMKVTNFNVKERSERVDDPGDYPSGAGGRALPSYDSYTIQGTMEVAVESKDPKYKDEDDLMDAIYDYATDQLKDEFGFEAAEASKHGIKARKIGGGKWRIDVNSDDYRLNELKSFKALIQEVAVSKKIKDQVDQWTDELIDQAVENDTGLTISDAFELVIDPPGGNSIDDKDEQKAVKTYLNQIWPDIKRRYQAAKSDHREKWGESTTLQEASFGGPEGVLLATQSSEWAWEYDQDRVEAKVYSGDKPDVYHLEVIRTHIKSGIGAGTQIAVLHDNQEKLNNIDAIIKPFGHQKSRAGSPFSRNKWVSATTGQMGSLSSLLTTKGQVKSLMKNMGYKE